MTRTTTTTLLALALIAGSAGAQQRPDTRELFERGVYLEEGTKDLEAAIAAYRRVAELAGSRDPGLAARALLRIAGCERLRGREEEAARILGELSEREDLPADVREEVAAALGGDEAWSTRAYEVGGLLRPPPEMTPWEELLLLPGDAARPARDQDVLSFEDLADAGLYLDAERLEELVREGIGEDAWDGPARLDVVGGRLLVHQTAAQQAAIARLLAELTPPERHVAFDLRLVAVSAALWRELRLAPGPLAAAQEEALAKRLATEGGGAFLLVERRAAGLDRQPLRVELLRSQPFLGLRLDQTGIVPDLTHELTEAEEGLRCELRPLVLPGAEDRMLLECRLSLTAWGATPLDERLSQRPDLDLPLAHQALLETSVVARDGQTLLLGGAMVGRELEGASIRPELPEPDPYPRLLVFVRPRLARVPADARRGPPPASGEEWSAHVQDAGALLHGARRGPPPSRPAEAPTVWRAPGASLDLDQLIETLEGGLPAELEDSSWIGSAGGGRLLVRGPAGAHEAVRERLDDLGRGGLRLLAVEAARLELEPGRLEALLRGAELTAAGVPTLSAAEAEALLAEEGAVATWAGATVRDGQVAVVAEVLQRRYIARYNVDVGGTGETHFNRVWTPVVAHVEEGLRLAARPRLLRDGRTVHLALDLELSELDGLTVRQTRFGPIHRPARQVDRHASSVELPLDRVLILGAERGWIESPGRGLLLVRVRALAE